MNQATHVVRLAREFIQPEVLCGPFETTLEFSIASGQTPFQRLIGSALVDAVVNSELTVPMQSPEPRLTLEQQAAIHTRDVSIGLSAGAGCGKTFVLTQRFLSHLEPGRHADPLSGIVALTFTERAAREMRDRIRDACHVKLEECPAEQVDHWLRIVRRLDSARISTIHAFCASLLRAHAVEAGIDPQFGLLDQAASDALLRNSIAQSLRELLSNQDEDCVQLVVNYGLERVGEQLRILVREWLRIDTDRFKELATEQLAVQWQHAWQHQFLPQLLDGWSNSAPVRHLLQLLKLHVPNNAEMSRRCATLLAGLPSVAQSQEPTQQLDELRGACQVKGGGGKGAWDDEEIYAAIRDAIAAVRKSIDGLQGTIALDRTSIPDAVGLGLMALRVTRQVGLRYDRNKSASSLLDFDDLLLRARKLLRDSQSVRRRAAAGVDLLMVDEFQDTDPVQADIIRLLCGAEWSRGKLFFVGDVKQSIYRFRRADPQVFKNSREELHERGRLPLSINFRSQPDILKFVNGLFSESMGPGYEPLRPCIDEQASPRPAIEFLFSAPDDPDQKEVVSVRRRREADWIARRITAFLSDGVARIRSDTSGAGPSLLRPARTGDVAILFRTLSNVAVYEDALRERELDYYLVGGRAFYAQQEVYDLINLCRFLDNADDEIGLAGVLRSPFFSLSDDALFAMCESGGSLSAGLAAPPPEHLPEMQRKQLRQATCVLEQLRSLKDRVPLVELLQRAISSTGYDAALLLEFLGPRKLANLRKLIEKAREFDRSGLFTLQDFAALLSDSIAQQTDEELAATHPETSDVVRLMTIHQAKGLEFPIVFIADMDWNKRGGSPIAHFDATLGPVLAMPRKRGHKPANPAQAMHQLMESKEEEAETNRLFYVAATRAADYLILSAGLPANGRVSSPWLKLLAQRFDLETGGAAFDPVSGRHVLAPAEIPEIRVIRTPPDAEPIDKQQASPLSKVQRFRELVNNCEPTEWPETLCRLHPDVSLRRTFSVSEIEEAVHDAAPMPRGEFRAKSRNRDSGKSAEVGTLVHNVLEQVDLHAPESLPELLEQQLQRASDSVRDSLRSKADTCLRAWSQSEIPKELGSAHKVFREVDFLLRWTDGGRPAAHIAGKIDCLYETGDHRWCVLDYKTGGHVGDNPATIRSRYGIQLCLYALAVRELLGRLPDQVEVLLLAEQAQRLTFDLSEEFLRDAGQKVDAAIGRLRQGD